MQQEETCECADKLPKDGLRARCPSFKARSSYHGKHYIVCGGRKLKFDSKSNRDMHYMVYCCGSCQNCTAMEGRPQA